MNESRIILPIKALPFFNFRSGRGNSDASLFYIPLECKARHRVTGKEEDEGKPCDEYISGEIYCGHINEKGKRVNHTLSKAGRHRKQHIERYNEYRMNLFHLAKKMKFKLQAAGMAIYYHFPIPIRWTKKKRAVMHGQFKASKSDLTNLQKSVEDSLTGQDEVIGQYSGSGKFWFDPDRVEKKLRAGYIEVLFNQPLYNPYNVELLNPYKTVAMEDVLSRREKLKARKLELKKEKEAEAKEERIKKSHKPIPVRLNQSKLFKKEDKIR